MDWYRWTMAGGPKPEFLKKPVAYYVIHADEWRYADTLESVTARTRALYLDSAFNATDVLASGSLGPSLPAGSRITTFTIPATSATPHSNPPLTRILLRISG